MYNTEVKTIKDLKIFLDEYAKNILGITLTQNTHYVIIKYTEKFKEPSDNCEDPFILNGEIILKRKRRSNTIKSVKGLLEIYFKYVSLPFLIDAKYKFINLNNLTYLNIIIGPRTWMASQKDATFYVAECDINFFRNLDQNDFNKINSSAFLKIMKGFKKSKYSLDETKIRNYLKSLEPSEALEITLKLIEEGYSL